MLVIVVVVVAAAAAVVAVGAAVSTAKKSVSSQWKKDINYHMFIEIRKLFACLFQCEELSPGLKETSKQFADPDENMIVFLPLQQ